MIYGLFSGVPACGGVAICKHLGATLNFLL